MIFDPPHWKKDDYQRIEAEHKQLLKELKNGYCGRCRDKFGRFIN